jgi:hypothetical protein
MAAGPIFPIRFNPIGILPLVGEKNSIAAPVREGPPMADIHAAKVMVHPPPFRDGRIFTVDNMPTR